MPGLRMICQCTFFSFHQQITVYSKIVFPASHYYLYFIFESKQLEGAWDTCHLVSLVLPTQPVVDPPHLEEGAGVEGEELRGTLRSLDRLLRLWADLSRVCCYWFKLINNF